MVSAWAGKAFPDMRQNEREIQFIRVGDAVRTASQLKGKPTPFREQVANFYSLQTGRVALGDLLGCSRVGHRVYILPNVGSGNRMV